MVSPTRRALLHSTAGALTALAGCGDQLTGSVESTQTVSQDEAGRQLTDARTDPERVQLRVDTDRQPIWLTDGESEPIDRRSPIERDAWGEFLLIDSDTRATRLTVSDDADSETVQSFLTATDFTSQTVYVDMRRVEECFRLSLCEVSWSPTEIATEYVQQLRAYTESCTVDERVIEAWLIRIPDTLDAEDLTGYSVSIGAGTCRQRQSRAESTRTSTPSKLPDEAANGRWGDH